MKEPNEPTTCRVKGKFESHKWWVPFSLWRKVELMMEGRDDAAVVKCSFVPNKSVEVEIAFQHHLASSLVVSGS